MLADEAAGRATRNGGPGVTPRAAVLDSVAMIGEA